MPNRQITNYQNQIEDFRKDVNASRKSIEDIELQLSRLKFDPRSNNDRERDDLLRQYDDRMDVLDFQLVKLEGAISSYTSFRKIRDFDGLQQQFISRKKQHRELSSNLKSAKEQLAKFTALEEKTVLEINEVGHQDLIQKFDQKITEVEAKITALEQEQPRDLIAIEAQRDIRRELKHAKRSKEEGYDEKVALLSQIRIDKQEKKDNVSTFSSSLISLAQSLEEMTFQISEYNDPRYLVSTFKDDTPFLLLPIRIETRYMDIKYARRVIPGDTIPGFSIPDKKELWVRIFPDDIAIHTHEKRLANDEENAGHQYWTAVWGLGEPAENEPDERLGAWRVLSDAYGPERAAWIVKQTEPTNLLIDPLPTLPVFPTLELKPSAWTEVAKTYTLPDRFVVRIYSDEHNYREVLGSQIPDPLTVGINPDNDLDDAFEQLEGEVAFPEEIKWLSDFNEAKNVGMGISIQLEETEENYIHRILVLGLKLSADKEEATQLVEEMIENHHYTAGGFSLIPQGTPTNNTEGVKSGFDKIQADSKLSWDVEINGPLFTNQSELLEKKDGQWFADLLGIDQDVVKHIFHSNGTDVCEAIAMNQSLWPATMGYFIKSMLHPHVSKAERNRVREFFNEYVTGRGKIPSFRVDNQPYGVIVSSAHSRWKYNTTSTQDLFYDRLNKNFLQPMSRTWGTLVHPNVNFFDIHGIEANPSEKFLDILGLHASSVQFHQRFANGLYKMWNLQRFIQSDGISLPAGYPVPEDYKLDSFLANYNAELALSMVEPPKIFELNYLVNDRLLTGPVIDGFDNFPYSEIRGIQPFPDTLFNYIHWLTEDSTTINRIRAEKFNNLAGIAPDQKPPKALLYLLLRHAYLQQYLESSTGILINANAVSSEAELEVELQGIGNTSELSAEEKKIVYNAVVEETVIEAKVQIKQRVQQEFQREESVPRYKIRARESELFQRSEKSIQESISSKFDQRINKYKSDQKKWDYLTKPVREVSDRLTMEEYVDSLVLNNDPKVFNLSLLKNSLNKLKGLPTARLERAFAEHLDLCNYRLDGWMTGLVTERLEKQQQANKGMYLGAFGMIENLRPNSNHPGVHVIEVNGQKEELPSSPEIISDFNYIGNQPIELERDSDSGEIRALPRVDSTNQGFIHGPSTNHAVTAAILRAGYISHKASTSNDDTLAVNLTSKRVRRALFYLEGIQNGQNLPELLGYRFERELHESSETFGVSGTDSILDKYLLDFRLKYPLTSGGVIDTDGAAPIETQEAKNVLDGLALINDYEEDTAPFITFLDDVLEVGDLEKAKILKAVDQIQDDMDALADLLLSESVYQLAKGNVERSAAVLKVLSEGGGYIQEPEIVKTPRQGAALTHRFGVQFDPFKNSINCWGTDGTARSIAEPGLNGWLADQLPDPLTIMFDVEYEKYDVGVDTDGDGVDDIITTQEKINLKQLGIEPIDFIYLMGDQGNSQDASELSNRITHFVVKNKSLADGLKVNIFYTREDNLVDGELGLIHLLPLIAELKKLIGNSRAMHDEDYLLAADAQIGTPVDPAAYLPDCLTKEYLEKIKGPTVDFSSNLTDLCTDISGLIATAGQPTDPMPAAGVLDDLRDVILKSSFYGIQQAFPSSVFTETVEERDKLVVIAQRLYDILNERKTKLSTILLDLGTAEDVHAINKRLTDAAQSTFGRSFKVYPNFKLRNKDQVDMTRGNVNLLNEIVDVIDELTIPSDMVVEEWLQGAAKVKPRLTNYQKVRLFSDALKGSEGTDIQVTQLPVNSVTDDRWLGMTLPDNYDIPGDTLSLVLELPDFVNTEANHYGMIVDEWVEIIPDKNVQTGVAMHYNQPNAEAPNSLIMAVTPEITGEWRWDDLMDTLNETLSLAKKRAVEPDHIKDTIWGQTLPALIAAISSNDSTPSLDFGRNNVNALNGQYGHIAPSHYAAE